MRTQRLDYKKANPAALQGMFQIEKYLARPEQDRLLYELVRLRASQINGCAYCIDMHTKDARMAGETEQRLYALTAWKEAPFYSERERAALAWTDALTRVSEHEISDALYKQVHAYFDDAELVALTMAIVVINGWNRLAIGLGAVPGSYVPQQH
ncbi:MAG TPA: carboxymuconolactone decarboxylase family protein [Spongiibacteraceae bacterium]|jgi:AhpD family alkylhydroperoxidase|nr:carboxymuconolactone decarboxylase family protein [Spongiibacteraceae bacterium]